MTEMIFVENVRFLRGSKNFRNEAPVVEIELSPYWIDKYPVTNGRFSNFIQSGGYSTRELWTELGWSFIQSRGIQKPLYWEDAAWNQPDQPVTGVSWWEALAFAKSEEKTLPTEAQWEYAAGKGQVIYPWGDEIPSPELANYAPGCEPAELHRRSTVVYEHPKGISRIGCYDMAGNLNEWCIDNISQNYLWDFYKQNPVFLSDEDAPHVVKGGSGLHDEDCLRCASRDYYRPEIRDNIVGIRCVRNKRA
ncbi:protein NirV [Paraburkholderia acidicola]|uniref:Protein NirV n=1 Tax=Paraburkholderia acidicola TaxID=1912599 RepID=A0A2A4F630_9BURK|nr:SUMF1/EgtB/PvdO family nonheme iron enzyme [Paraburkholderia acidicola]PCE28152.1 protein NirV [Paraburkholderia acidicola]